MKQVGKSENYKIYLNESYALTLTLETIYKNNLKVDKEISTEQLEQIQFDNEKITAFEKAVNLLSKASKTKKDMEKYLKTKGYSSKIITYVTEKLEGYRYLDDKQFSESYIDGAKKFKGKRLIEQILLQKGVNKDIIKESLKELNQEQEVLLLAEKYMKNKDKTSENKQKLYRHLLSKGFSYDEVGQAISKIYKGGFYDWD